MPQYEFRCPNPKCPASTFLVKMSISKYEREAPPYCPACGAESEIQLQPFCGNFGDTPKFTRGFKS